jgi:hypothetical protein
MWRFFIVWKFVVFFIVYMIYVLIFLSDLYKMNRFFMLRVITLITFWISWCTYPETDQIFTPETTTYNSSTIRQGPKPSTTQAPMNTNIAHQQVDQNSPIAIQEELWSFMSTLPWVETWNSRLSVSWARALYVPWTSWPVLSWDERVHLHPSYDWSLHIALDTETMRSLVENWRWEYHPRNPNSIMLYWPRDEKELSFIKDILLAWSMVWDLDVWCYYCT